MIRMAVRCRPDQAELVLAELTVLAPGGVEESHGTGFVEYAIYGAEGELPDLGQVEAATGDGLVAVDSSEVPADWSERWRAFHRPLEVVAAEGGTAIWLRPPWEPRRDDALEVVIDPGQAFGTGAHPTTRLSLELLLGLYDEPASDGVGTVRGALTDLGCGSGVLAIAAARLGFSPVTGFDHDRAAISAAIDNAAANRVEATFRRLDLRRGLPDLAPLTLANLTAPLLELVAAQIDRPGRPDRMICSGLLEGERGRVVDAFAGPGLAEREFRALEGWGALLLEAA
ncbi:MAG: 50S ribosomal protein L11 methyltransferase [Solirubrobacterales bacterium]|nr:50S ribosomal protein L11 methyltransferase [Solirubrobacterales bacterium]